MNERQRIEAYLQSILTSVQDITRRMQRLDDAGKAPVAGTADQLQRVDSELGEVRDEVYTAYEGEVK